MKKNRNVLVTGFLLPFLLFPLLAFSQTIKVSGTVKEANGAPVPGVNIKVVGTSIGTISSLEGTFQIDAPADGTLEFSSVGYSTKTVAINNQAALDVTLESSDISTDEVVVVGYGAVKKKDLTSAIAVVDAETLTKAPVANISSALQGITAGIEVQGNQGRPGEMPAVRIRGVSSTNTTDPLYVIDGIPTDNAYFSPSDIESMQVLKDAASCAIYGSRGANGVIIITTKKGKTGAPKVKYSGYYGIEQPWKQIDLLNTRQWADVIVESNPANGFVAPAFATEVHNNPNGPWEHWDGKETDWQGAVFQSGAIYENNIDISGGTDNGNYYFSANQFDQEGIIICSPYKRYSVRMNSSWQSNKFKFGENISYVYSQNRREGTNGGRTAIEELIKITPNIPIYNPDRLGGYSGYDGTLMGHDASNPVGSLERQRNMNYNKRLLLSVFGEYQILKDLSFRSTLGINASEYQNRNLVLKTDMPPKTFANTTLSESSTWNTTWVWEQMLTYHKVFGDHDLTVMGAYTAESYKQHVFSGNGNTIQTEVNDVLSKTETGYGAGGSEQEISRISYLGRVMYAFKGKYILTANFRRDGSSKFGTGNKWGNFPSASLAWRISDESFIKGIDQISNLKLRTSYGIVGNDAPVGAYSYKSGLSSGQDYILNGVKASGVSVTGFNNSDISWETVKQFDIGLDLGLFKGTIEATADFFDKRTEDMLIGVPLPGSSGSSANLTQNLGSILNRGFEFSLTFRKKIGELDFSVTGNLATLHNEVLDISGVPISAGAVEFSNNCTRTDKGQPIGSFYGYQMLGVFPDQAAVTAYTLNGNMIQPNAKEGDVQWADRNNNGRIDADDRYFMGSPIPTLTYGLNANLTYKGFDLSFFFQGVHGNSIYAELVAWTEGMHNNFNLGTAALDRWTTDNRYTDIPRAVRNDPNENIKKCSDRYIKDGDYLRLKNVVLGYTLPKSIVEKIKLSNIRVYATGRNLLTFTKYPFYDPEIGSGAQDVGGTANTSRGIDNGYYPQARTLIMGAQIDF